MTASAQALSLQPVAQLAMELHALFVELQERRQQQAQQAQAQQAQTRQAQTQPAAAQAARLPLSERARLLSLRARELGAQWRANRPTLAVILDRTAQRVAALDWQSVDLGASGRRAQARASVKIAQYYEGLARQLRNEPSLGLALPELRPRNYARNAFHIANGLLGATLYTVWPDRAFVLKVAIGYALAMLSLEAARRLSTRLNRWLVDDVFGAIARPSEAWRMNSATWYGIAVVLMLAVGFPRLACVSAVLTLGIGDPMAALIGKRWGRHKLYGPKSLEGVLAFVASSALLVAAWMAVFEVQSFGAAGHWGALVAALPMALVAGAVGAGVELVSNRLEDNFTIPLAVAASVALLAP